MKKILALLLLLCMLLPTLVACSGDEMEAEGGAEQSLTEETNPLPEADPAWVGKEYNIFFRGNYDYEFVYVEENAGALINDAVYQRNQAVESRYGIKLVFSPSGTSSFENDFLEPINNTVMSGDDTYQLAAGYTYRLAPNSVKGSFLDWYSMPNINLDGEWWDRGFVDAASYNGHSYVMTGSLSLSHLYSLSCVFFNQDIVNANFENEGGSDAIYDLVKEGKWTYDEFYTYISKCTVLETEMDETDTYGYASNDTTAVDSFLFAFDISVSTRNSKGKIVLNKQNNDEKLLNATKKLNELFNTSGHTYNQSTDSVADLDVHIGMMSAGKAAFTTSYLKSATVLRTTDINYGVLPFPKWDAEQTSYYSNNMDFASSFSIPQTVQDKEYVGAITEAMAYYSHQYVREALYGTVLKYRDAKDSRSSESIDIILNNVKYDFAVIYAFEWGDVNGPSMELRKCIRDKSSALASRYEMNEKFYKTTLEDLLKAFK